MRWLVDLGTRAGPALLLPLFVVVVTAAAFTLRRLARARLRGRLTAALRALGPPAREPFAASGGVITLDGVYARDAAVDGRAWLVVADQRVSLEGPRRLLVGSVEPWSPTGRRSLARGVRVRARGTLRPADEASAPAAPWTLTPDGDALALAALDPAHLRDVPSTAWALATGATLAVLFALLSAGGRWAVARVDAASRPVALTPHGIRWQSRWTLAQQAQLALANVSPLDHRAAQRLLRGGRLHETSFPWLDVREMHRVREAIHAHGDCALEADFLRRTGEAPPPDDRCGLRALIDAHPLAQAVRAETARTPATPAVQLACLDRHAAALRAGLADAALPGLLRAAVACVRDAATVCGPEGCPEVVPVDLARLLIEHRVALRATTHGPALRPVWWRRPSLLRANVRRLAAVATALALDTLDARYARGEEWPQAFTWGSVVAVMRTFPTAAQGYRPIVAHLPGVGVEPGELANPWSSPELRAASGNARLAALIEWWRLGEYVPARDAPARERSELVRRAVAAAASRRVGPVLAALGDPTVESVEALALVAYRLTGERADADPWLRGAAGFLPPDPGAHGLRCRLRTALRQAAQRLRRTEFLAAQPWAAESARACAFGDETAAVVELPAGE